MKKRLLALLMVFVPAFALHAQPPQRFQVHEATIGRIHAAMKARQLTCRALVAAYLRRVEAYDRTGPALNSLVQINADAPQEADALDRRFTAAGGIPADAPLHCVPMIVKDNFETIGLQSAAGSLAMKGFVSSRDAFLVKRVKEAGAIVLAKSNMAEWAFSPYETVSSILPGYTRNPYALDRVTAGSSGGTAAAIAASFGTVGLGSDTGNSIRGPSAHQALAGIRSTMGLTSRAGVAPLSLLADIAGPMARTLEDAVAVFQAIAGDDPDDPVTLAGAYVQPGLRPGGRPAAMPDFRAALVRDGLKGARIGVLRQAYERDTTDPDVVSVFMAAVKDLERAGATIVDPAPVDLARVTRAQGAGSCGGFKHDINRYLAAHGDRVPVRSLDEIVRSRRYHPSVQLRLERAQETSEVNGPESSACKAEADYREQFRAAVLKTIEAHQLHAFVYPTWSNPPRLIGDLNTPHGDNSQVFSPTTGFPAVNVPMGYTRGGTLHAGLHPTAHNTRGGDPGLHPTAHNTRGGDPGLPAGITFFGKPWDEATLIRLAYSYEQATKHRRPPATTPPVR